METNIIHALPTPTETPYRTPTSSLSRRSREFGNMSPSITPPPLPSAEFRPQRRRSNDSNNAALDESISPLDPRRFTPTLHANLVSEILSLRRDLDSKTKDIDQLEQSLHATQAHNESLSKSLTTSNKEARSIKRQMQLLEAGTLSAITDLSKERDTAVEEALDLRKRLEHSQKKTKTHSENADRAQQLWEKDKEAWAAEKRAMETKVHVIEGRLKAVLDEVASAQHVVDAAEHESQRPESRISSQGSPVKQPVGGPRDRRQSAASDSSDHVGGRTSALSFTKGTPVNLADELALEDFDGIEANDHLEHEDGRISPDALPEERGRPASSLSIKARKVLGLPFDFENMEHSERRQSVGDALNQDTATRSNVLGSTNADHPALHAQAATITTEAGKGQATRPDAIMVSSSCQTMDYLPSPPTTPRQHEAFLATIHESVWERPETKEIATQTDRAVQLPKTYQYVHSRTDTHDLGIPTIAIIPPGSRPGTPLSTVVLPPHTKNASCQVSSELPLNYTSTSMQTEEIRIDRRNLLHAQPGLTTANVNDTYPGLPAGKQTNFSRRNGVPVSNSAMKRSAPPAHVTANLPKLVLNDMEDDVDTNMFAGYEDQPDENEGQQGDDIFEDDDVFKRPTAKYTLRAGKIVSQERSFEDIGKLAAISAGEAIALENLRQSEDALPPELRGQLDAMNKAKSLKRTTTIRRGQSSTARSNSSSMRKNAMISNGAAAHHHQHKLSQSTNASSEGGGVAPPIPIPLRYSSARLGKTFSEGGRTSRSSSNASPTRQGRRIVKPVLRKTRSGPALSPAAVARRRRSKSPPLDSRISIVPEMPVFDMPDRSKVTGPISFLNSSQDAVAPRPSIATGPSRQAQHSKNNSDAPLAQQNSVVDAIAQTMVGEWMFKYVRRRKSFGKPEKDWDPNKSADELINNPGSAGVRHKRWVWVAPYERAVMWSSKQPMNGTALMGKNGRKLTIKSVLDVKDDNPMPKNSLSGASFNRSILILTPQRALKFTAVSQERHYVWLTALSFLSHSPLSVGELAALPPPNEVYQDDIPSPSLVGSLPKRRIRDSIRLAKASNKPSIGPNTFLPDITTEANDYYGQRPATSDTYDQATDAALPPVIKRFHTRKRSNTAPKAPPSAFRTFPSIKESGSSAPSSNYSYSVGTTDRGSSDQGPYTPSFGHPSFPSTRRGSEASGLGRPGNFYNFDSNSSHNASMTMRMDAFIENKQAGKGGYKNLSLPQGGKAPDRKKEFSFWGFDESGMPSLSPVESTTATDNGFRYSDSTGRGSVERDYFRNF